MVVRPCVCRCVFIVTPSIEMPTLPEALAVIPPNVVLAVPFPMTPGIVSSPDPSHCGRPAADPRSDFAGRTVPTEAVDAVSNASAAAVTSTACATFPTCKRKVLPDMLRSTQAQTKRLSRKTRQRGCRFVRSRLKARKPVGSGFVRDCGRCDSGRGVFRRHFNARDQSARRIRYSSAQASR